MKLTAGVPVTNILKAAFSYKSFFEAFLAEFVTFLAKRNGVQKLLVKYW